jgi:hypothetical protein
LRFTFRRSSRRLSYLERKKPMPSSFQVHSSSPRQERLMQS